MADIFQTIFWNTLLDFDSNSSKFSTNSLIDNKWGMVHMLACHQTGDKPLPEAGLIKFHKAIYRWYPAKKGPTHHANAWQIGPFWQDTLDIFTRLQWVESLFPYIIIVPADVLQPDIIRSSANM